MKVQVRLRSDDSPERRAANIAAVLWTGGDPKLLAEQTDTIARVLRAYEAVDAEVRNGTAHKAARG